MAKKKETVVVQPDILGEKKEQLNTYVLQFNSAVSLVTDTINSLKTINEGIEATIGEIEAYQAQLQETKQGLLDTRDKNYRVVRNFTSLLDEQ